MRRDPQIFVLFVAASQISGVRNRADIEFKKISEKLLESKYRDHFHFERIQAVRFGDIRTALLRHTPHVLHISSQGEADGSLTFESDEAGRHVIAKQQLLRLLRALRDRLQLVFFNSWYSHVLARDIPQIVDLAIGMNTTVPDELAVEFSVAFYEALAFGRTVENAVDVALANLDDEHQLTLYPPAGEDPDHRRQLRFASPAGP